MGRITESAMAKLRGELAPKREQTQDRDTIERRARADGVDLEGEAERAREKLRTVNGARE